MKLGAVRLVRRGLMALVMLLDAADDICSAVEVVDGQVLPTTYCAVSGCYRAAPVWVRSRYWVCDCCLHSKAVSA